MAFRAEQKDRVVDNAIDEQTKESSIVRLLPARLDLSVGAAVRCILTILRPVAPLAGRAQLTVSGSYLAGLARTRVICSYPACLAIGHDTLVPINLVPVHPADTSSRVWRTSSPRYASAASSLRWRRVRQLCAG